MDYVWKESRWRSPFISSVVKMYELGAPMKLNDRLQTCDCDAIIEFARSAETFPFEVDDTHPIKDMLCDRSYAQVIWLLLRITKGISPAVEKTLMTELQSSDPASMRLCAYLAKLEMQIDDVTDTLDEVKRSNENNVTNYSIDSILASIVSEMSGIVSTLRLLRPLL